MDQEDLIRSCCDEGVIEERLYYLGEIEDVSGEGEVALRYSMQMCQWIALLEPFIPEADVLLESLLEVTNAIVFKVEQCQLRRKGRPCIPISDGQIRFFIEHNFKVVGIAKLCGCSRRTIEQRMHEYNISMLSSYSHISDS